MAFSFGYFCTGLEINFDEVDYSTDEGDIMGLNISLSLRETQAPFKMELIPVTIDVARQQYDLDDFLTLSEIQNDQKALSGDILNDSIQFGMHCPD